MLLLYVQDIKLRFETHYDIIFLGTDLVLTNVWFLPPPAAEPELALTESPPRQSDQMQGRPGAGVRQRGQVSA